MKVKCIRLLDVTGKEISEWHSSLKLKREYHVMSIYIDSEGQRTYGIIVHDRDPGWATLHQYHASCFEIISEIVPSNWRVWVGKDLTLGISPAAWQEEEFQDAFYDSDPATYPIFERERDIIRKEDP